MTSVGQTNPRERSCRYPLVPNPTTTAHPLKTQHAHSRSTTPAPDQLVDSKDPTAASSPSPSPSPTFHEEKIVVGVPIFLTQIEEEIESPFREFNTPSRLFQFSDRHIERSKSTPSSFVDPGPWTLYQKSKTALYLKHDLEKKLKKTYPLYKV